MTLPVQPIGLWGELAGPVTVRPHSDANGAVRYVGTLELGDSETGPAKARHVEIGDKIGYIMRLIRQGSQHPRVVETARRIVAAIPDKDELGEIRAVWKWLKENVRYVKDPDGMEVIQTAERLLDPKEILPADLAKRMPTGPLSTGDCDEMGAVLAGALLKAIGKKVRAALWAKPHGQWQHIFVLAYVPKQKFWVAVDPTEKAKPFGWLPPMGRWTAFRYDDDGVPQSRVNCELGGLGSFFKKIGRGIKKAAKKVGKIAKQALPAVASFAATAIPGIGPMVAPMVGKLTNSLVNQGKPNPIMNIANSVMGKGGNPLQAVSQVVGKVIPGWAKTATNVVSQMVPGLQQAIPPQLLQAMQQGQQPTPQQAQHVAPTMAQQAMQQLPAMAAQMMHQIPAMQQMLPYATPEMYQRTFFQQPAQPRQAYPSQQPYPQQQRQPYPQQQRQAYPQQPRQAYPQQQRQAYPQQPTYPQQPQRPQQAYPQAAYYPQSQRGYPGQYPQAPAYAPQSRAPQRAPQRRYEGIPADRIRGVRRVGECLDGLFGSSPPKPTHTTNPTGDVEAARAVGLTMLELSGF